MRAILPKWCVSVVGIERGVNSKIKQINKRISNDPFRLASSGKNGNFSYIGAFPFENQFCGPFEMADTARYCNNPGTVNVKRIKIFDVDAARVKC